MLVPLFALLFLCCNADNFAPLFSRTVLQVFETPAVLGGNPTLDILDFGHAKALALYDATEFNAFLDQGFAYYVSTFGIDFLSAPAVPGPFPGAYSHPLGLLIPYGVDPNTYTKYKIAADSSNKKRGDEEQWFIAEYGLLFLSNSTATFPGGSKVGYAITPGGILAWTEYNYLRTGANWTSPDCDVKSCREKVKARSEQPSFTGVNSEGQSHQYITVTLTDSDGRTGYANGYITTVVTTNTTGYQRGRITSTWNY